MPKPAEWSRAFARQSMADLRAYQLSCINSAVPSCHRFQYLQMACEKLAKSFLCAGGSDSTDIQSSHAYTARVLPMVIRQEIVRLGPIGQKRLGWFREIELLSPSVTDAGRRPANCEYPWVDPAGALHVPADETFPNLSGLFTPMGREMMKVLQIAVERLVTS